MSFKNFIPQEAPPLPPHILVHGSPGVGKTTFVSNNNALLVDCENGANWVTGLKKTGFLEDWATIRKWLYLIAGEEKDPEIDIIAIDTLDWLLRRIKEYAVSLDPKSAASGVAANVGSSHGGYGKGAQVVENIVFQELFPVLNAIRGKGYAVVLLCHSVNREHLTPEGYTEQVATPDLPKELVNFFIEWADAVGYAKHEKSTGERIMKMVGSGNVMAKNRFGLPAEIEFTWPAFVAAVKESRKKPEESN